MTFVAPHLDLYTVFERDILRSILSLIVKKLLIVTGDVKTIF